ncbi:MAG TPA: acetyl-CoA acetyltransferase [Candidatus Binataceae bacterium]|nr:acetyl-CoA acetyltransferase [Candidatus Binataceae bacterium]
MSLSRKTCLVGVYEHPTRFAPDKSQFQIAAESIRGALDDCGLTIKDVDGLAMAGTGIGPMGIIGFCDYLNLNPNYADGTQIGGSSFVAHTAHAAAAIAAGLCEVCVVAFGSTVASSRGGGAGGGGDTADQFEIPFGVTTVGAYAMIAQRHMHEYGTTSEQLAEVAVTMRLHASMNPVAKYRNPITVDDVLSSRIISSPLHLLDCCIISDGGGALVITSAERARDLKKKPVYILGTGEAMRHAGRGKRDFLDIAAAQSGKLAFERAGVTHADIDMGMIYDSFTITVVSQLENLGFCKPGEGGAFVSGGRLRFDGDFPINTDGGGLSSCHPMMRGMFLVIEATKQLRGECGPRQVKDCKTALVHGTGGALGTRHSGATLILSNQ